LVDLGTDVLNQSRGRAPMASRGFALEAEKHNINFALRITFVHEPDSECKIYVVLFAMAKSNAAVNTAAVMGVIY